MKAAKGCLPPSPLVRVAGATVISSEEIVSSELINLFECNVYIKNKLVICLLVSHTGATLMSSV